MKCPFKKIITQKTSRSESGGTIVTTIEEFKECELDDCMAIVVESFAPIYKCKMMEKGTK